MMKSKKANEGSILDAKHAIPPNLLSFIRMGFVLAGLVAVICMLYVAGWYSQNVAFGILAVTIVVWVVLTYFVDNANEASRETNMAHRVNQKNTEGISVQKYIDASYEELEQLGREELELDEEGD